MFKRREASIHDGDDTRPDMAQVLSTGLEFLEHSNPNGNPCVKGYNIINGELKQASDGATFKSTNPAWLDDWEIEISDIKRGRGFLLFLLLG